MKTWVFVNGQQYRPDINWPLAHYGFGMAELRLPPRDAYIRMGISYWSHVQGYAHWMRSDLTPVLDQDVPQELKALALVLDALE